MKLLPVTVVLTAAVALSSASASEHTHKHRHYRNAYNSMNMTHGSVYAPSYGTGYHSYGSYEDSVPGGTNLSGTGSSQYGGGAGDSGSSAGAGP